MSRPEKEGPPDVINHSIFINTSCSIMKRKQASMLIIVVFV